MYFFSKIISISFSILGCFFVLMFFNNCCTKYSLCIKNDTDKNIRIVSHMKGKSVDNIIDPYREREMSLHDVIVFSENDCIEITDTRLFLSDDKVKKEHVYFPNFGCLNGVICIIYIKSSNEKIYYDYSGDDGNYYKIKSYLRKR